MNIVVHCEYTAPARDSQGGERMMEALAKGFVELGHNVKMFVNADSTFAPAPMIRHIPDETDIILGAGADLSKFGKKWFSIVHGGGSDKPGAHWHNNSNYLCVSQYICNLSVSFDILPYLGYEHFSSLMTACIKRRLLWKRVKW